MSRPTRSQLRPWRTLLGVIVFVMLGIIGFAFLLHGKNIPVFNPQGTIGEQEKSLIIFTLLLSLVIVIPVFTLLAVIAVKYRADNKDATYTPDVDGDERLETLWWGIPIIIISILGVVTWISTHQLDPYKPLNSNVAPITVQVVALQWKWLFLYPGEGIASLNELRVPAGTPINFELTSDGPMSAMWIPSLGTQTYAMAGMSAQLHLEADHPGTYRGSNSNISGTGYADMNFQAIAMKPQDFDNWVKNITTKPNHDEMDLGEYQLLSKPSRGDGVAYYHLHDESLYTDIMSKFSPSGDGTTGDQ